VNRISLNKANSDSLNIILQRLASLNNDSVEGHLMRQGKESLESAEREELATRAKSAIFSCDFGLVKGSSQKPVSIRNFDNETAAQSQ
jgi:hypothetical protein